MANVVTLQIVIDSRGAVSGGRLVTGQLRNIQQQARQTATHVRQLDGSFDRLKTSLMGMRGILATFGLGAFLRELVQTNLAFSQIETTLYAASNSTAEVASNFAFVRSEAIRLGADVTQVGMEFSRLAAAAKGTSLEGQKIRDVFSATVEAFVATGQSVEQTRLGIFALQQMISKGRVQAEELRGQFGERLPGAFQAAARALGVTTQQLNKMLENGEVVAEDLLPKLAVELRKTFGTAFEEALRRPRFAIGQFTALIREFIFRISEGGFMDSFVNTLRRLTDFIQGPEGQDLADFIGKVLDVGMTAAGESILFLARNVDILVASLAALAASRAIVWATRLWRMIESVGRAFLMVARVVNPVVRVVSIAIGAATAAATLFNDKMITMGDHTARLSDYIAVAWDKIVGVITEVSEWARRNFGFIFDWLEERIAGLVEVFFAWAKAVGSAIDTVIKFFMKIIIIVDESATFFWQAWQKVLANLMSRFLAFGSGIQALLEFDWSRMVDEFSKVFSTEFDIGFQDTMDRIEGRIEALKDFSPVETLLISPIEAFFEEWGRLAEERMAGEMEIEMRMRQLQSERMRTAREAANERAKQVQNALGESDELSKKEQREIERILKKIADMELEVLQRERLIDAMKRGKDAVREVERQAAIENAVRDAGLSLLEKEGTLRHTLAEQVKELAGRLFDLTEEQDKQEEYLKVLEEITAQEHELALARLELAMIQAPEDERELALALLKEQLALQEREIELTSEAAQKKLENIRVLHELNTEIDRQRDALQELKSAAGEVFESIGDFIRRPLEEGKTAWEDFEETALNVLNTILDAMWELVITNPLRNMFLGENNTTFDDILDVLGDFDWGNIFGFGGGGGGGIDFPVFGGLYHRGGSPGSSVVPHRAVPASAFADAPRLHNGLFGRNEFPAILERGEKVIPRGGMVGEGDVIVTVNNYTSEPATKTETTDSTGRKMIDIVIGRVKNDIEQNGQISRAIQTRFDLQLKPGAKR